MSTDDLAAFLQVAFAADELGRWLWLLPSGRPLAARYAALQAEGLEHHQAAVGALTALGRVDRSLFEELLAARPFRAAEVQALAAAWLGADAPPVARARAAPTREQRIVDALCLRSDPERRALAAELGLPPERLPAPSASIASRAMALLLLADEAGPATMDRLEEGLRKLELGGVMFSILIPGILINTSSVWYQVS